MTPRQQRIVDFICDAAVTNKTPFHFEVIQPSDRSTGAKVRLSRKPFPSMFDTDALAITTDGRVLQTNFTQSYDRDLSAFIKRILSKAKKIT